MFDILLSKVFVAPILLGWNYLQLVFPINQPGLDQ